VSLQSSLTVHAWCSLIGTQ